MTTVAGEVLDVSMLEELRSMSGGDAAFLIDLFELYVSQSRELLRQMHASLRTDEPAAFARLAHALAGSSLNVGAKEVAEISRAIELAVIGGSLHPDASHVEKIGEALQRAHEAAETRLTSG